MSTEPVLLKIPAPRNWPIFRPRTDQQLRECLWQALGIVIPDVTVCAQHGPHREHTTPFRVFADAFFARHSVMVAKASRGLGGKSRLMSALGIAEGVFLGAEVSILGGSFEQAGRILENMDQIWAAPRAQPLRTLLGINTVGRKRTRLITGGEIKALMASQKSVRGGHPQRLRIDEADEMDLSLLDAAMGQPMAREGDRALAAQTLIASTQQYSDGTMSECLNRAAEGKYASFEWCWRECVRSQENPLGWLSPATVREKRLNVTQSMWEAEYEGQEPNPASRAIMPDRVRDMFSRDLGEYKVEYGEMIWEKWDHNGVYTAGADWGKEHDATVIVVLRWEPGPKGMRCRVVAYRRVFRQDYPVMVGYFDRLLEMFQARATHDKTGVGVPVDDLITYRNPRPIGVPLVGADRSTIFNDYISAIENGQIISPFIHRMEREHRLCSVDDLTGGGHPPDTFVAGALAYHAGKRVRPLSFMSV